MTDFDLASADDRGTLYKLVVARSDFIEALFTARYVIANVHDPRDELWFPLQDAIVVSYARPFTGNRPLGSPAPEWSVFGDPKLQSLHDDLIELRHKTIAHSDAAIRRVLIVPPGVKLGATPTSVSERVLLDVSGRWRRRLNKQAAAGTLSRNRAPMSRHRHARQFGRGRTDCSDACSE